MIINEVKESMLGVTLDDIYAGNYFTSHSDTMCDIVLIIDNDHNIQMVNAHNFMTLRKDILLEDILDYLNENKYRKIKVKIVAV